MLINTCFQDSPSALAKNKEQKKRKGGREYYSHLQVLAGKIENSWLLP